MKLILTLLLLASGFGLRAQEGYNVSPDRELSAVTYNRLQEEYTPADLQDLKNHPAKLAVLEYIYAGSYTVVSGQAITDAQLQAINVNLHTLERRVDERAIVFASEAGLTIELQSLNEMDAAMNAILGYTYFTNGPVKLNEN